MYMLCSALKQSGPTMPRPLQSHRVDGARPSPSFQVFDFGGMFNDAFLNDASIGPEAAPSQLVLAAAWDMRRPLESNDRLAVRGERAKELEPRGERADTESERLRENLDQEVPVTEPGRRTWTRVNWVGQDKS